MSSPKEYNTSAAKSMRTKTPTKGGTAPTEPILGAGRVYFCVLCQDYIFLCNPVSATDPSANHPLYIEDPIFYITIEFAKLKIVRNGSGKKVGFTLWLKDIHNEFLIQVPGGTDNNITAKQTSHLLAELPKDADLISNQ